MIAHRGARRQAPENTVAAFRRAVELGADGIELDVRRTADGTLVTHHDAVLADGRVLVETRAADLPAHVPTLAAALDACAGAWVDIEIKNDPQQPDFDLSDRVAAEVVAALDGRAHDGWMISSFRLATVDRCRRLAPGVRTAWLVLDVDDDAIAHTVAAGHAAVKPLEPPLTAELVDRCRAAGLEVYPWTCNDPRRAAELADWGAAGIITDVPDVLLAARDGPHRGRA